MRKSFILVTTAAIAATAVTAWIAWPRPVRIDSTDPALVSRGEPLYQQHCASCHGARLEGQPDWQSRNARGRLPAPPHDDSGHTWHHDDQVLFEVTKYGIARHAPSGYESDMPDFGDALSDADNVATLAYIKSRWSPSIHAKRKSAGMN